MPKKYFAQIYVEYELNDETPEVEAEDFAKHIGRDISRMLGVTDAYMNDWGRDYDRECPICGQYDCD